MSARRPNPKQNAASNLRRRNSRALLPWLICGSGTDDSHRAQDDHDHKVPAEATVSGTSWPIHEVEQVSEDEGPSPSTPLSVTEDEACESGADKEPLSTSMGRQQRKPASHKNMRGSSASQRTSQQLVRQRRTRRDSLQSRCRDSNSQENNDGGDDAGAEHPQKMLFACPFYKYNAMRYMSCGRLRITRIRDVKQHLSRRHRRPMHCPACGDVFADSRRWDAHIRARNCQLRRPILAVEGITESQAAALARRVNRSHSQLKQWFSIWHIVFPSSPLPLSPYLSNHFEETFSMIFDYWARHGGSLIADAVKPYSATLDGQGNNLASDVARVSSRVIERLLFLLRSHSQTAMDPTRSNPTAVESSPNGFIGVIPPLGIPEIPSPEVSPPSTFSQPCQQTHYDDTSIDGSGSSNTIPSSCIDSLDMIQCQSQCTFETASVPGTIKIPFNTSPDCHSSEGASLPSADWTQYLRGGIHSFGSLGGLGESEGALSSVGSWDNIDAERDAGFSQCPSRGMGDFFTTNTEMGMGHAMSSVTSASHGRMERDSFPTTRPPQRLPYFRLARKRFQTWDTQRFQPALTCFGN